MKTKERTAFRVSIKDFLAVSFSNSTSKLGSLSCSVTDEFCTSEAAVAMSWRTYNTATYYMVSSARFGSVRA
jgi:hypothetical protein